MYETPKSELVNFEKVALVYKFIKGINLCLLFTFFGLIVLKVIIFPASDTSIGLRIFMSIVLSLFMVPYILSLRAFPPKNRARKAAIITSIIWCLFIVVGISVQQQGIFVNLAGALLLLISAINIIFLTKIFKAKH